MTLNLSMPNTQFELKPKITVVGVGGAGGNAVNNMIKQNLEGVEFIVANTDSQALSQSLCQRRIQLGQTLTSGLGAGSRPDVGRAAAEEALDEIIRQLQGSNMVFITAGMGGGTGTGAGPVIAAATREQGILTVGVVTKPFHFEGLHRMRVADAGIQEMQQFVDTLIIIPNQNLFRVANEKTTFADAFNMADQVLDCGVRGVTDLMVKPGLINLDFADIRAVMTEMGKAMMGTGEAEGPNRAIAAAEAAISNPLLDDVSMKGARGVLINITGGLDMTLFEVDEAANRIRSEVDPEANIIFGSTFDQSLEGKVRISVVATGIESLAAMQPRPVSLSLVTSVGRVVAAAPAERAEPGFAATSGNMEVRRETAGANALAAAPVSVATPMSQANPILANPALAEAPRAAAIQAPVAQTQMAPAPLAQPATQPAFQAATPRAMAQPAAQRMAQPAAQPASSQPTREAAVARSGPAREERPVAAPSPSERLPQAQSASEPAAPARKMPNLFSRVTGSAWSRVTAGDREPVAPQMRAAPAARPATPAPTVNAALPLPAAQVPASPAPAPAAQTHVTQTHAAQTQAAQPHAASSHAAPPAQPRLSGLDPKDRLATSRAEEDLLDIPAFLRRQAN